MDIAIPLAPIVAFILVMARVGGIFFFAPIFGSSAIPVLARAGLALFVAFSFYPRISAAALPQPNDAFGFTLAILGELMIGMVIGLIAQSINAAVQFGGHVIGTHLGIRIANVFDPVSQDTTTIMGAFMNVVVVLLLLSFDFHLILLQVVSDSYVAIPPLGAQFNLGVVDVLIRMGTNVFVFAVQIIFPVLVAIFFIEVIIGVMAKTAQQFNMLMLQFPIKIIVGLFFMLALLVGFPGATEYMLKRTMELIHQALGFMGR